MQTICPPKQGVFGFCSHPFIRRLRLRLCRVPGRRTEQGQYRNQSPSRKYTKIDQNLTLWLPLYHCANKNDTVSAEHSLLVYAEQELIVKIRHKFQHAAASLSSPNVNLGFDLICATSPKIQKERERFNAHFKPSTGSHSGTM